MATLQLLARCRTSGSGSSLNSAKISLAALGARTVLCCLLILKLFPPFQMTYEKRPLLERSIPECRSQSLCLLCIAQSSFQQQSTPNVVFLTRGFYLGRFELPFMRILYQTSRLSPITNAVSSAAKAPRGSGRLGDAPLPMRSGGGVVKAPSDRPMEDCGVFRLAYETGIC